MSYRVYKRFALSRNDKESKNPVLWPWPLTLRVRAVVKIHVCAKSSCSVQWFMRTEKKNSEENNTIRRYRADSKY